MTVIFIEEENESLKKENEMLNELTAHMGNIVVRQAGIFMVAYGDVIYFRFFGRNIIQRLKE